MKELSGDTVVDGDKLFIRVDPAFAKRLYDKIEITQIRSLLDFWEASQWPICYQGSVYYHMYICDQYGNARPTGRCNTDTDYFALKLLRKSLESTTSQITPTLVAYPNKLDNGVVLSIYPGATHNNASCSIRAISADDCRQLIGVLETALEELEGKV